MAARTNKRDPRAARTLRRISFVREVKQSFLIICEGVNTEPDYFNAFRLTSANIGRFGLRYSRRYTSREHRGKLGGNGRGLYSFSCIGIFCY